MIKEKKTTAGPKKKTDGLKQTKLNFKKKDDDYSDDDSDPPITPPSRTVSKRQAGILISV